VYLVHHQRTFETLALKVHQLKLDFRTLGYTVHDDASVVARAPDLGLGTAQHELFHLLARVNFGDIPTWFDEGVASVYEVSRRCGNSYYGVTNWRTKVVQRFGLSQLRELVLRSGGPFDDATEHRYSEDISPNAGRVARDMATARFFAVYLQELGKLGVVFASLRDRDPASAAAAGEGAVTLLEGALGKSLAGVQKDFEKWYRERGRRLQYTGGKCARASWGAVATPPAVVAFDPGP